MRCNAAAAHRVPSIAGLDITRPAAHVPCRSAGPAQPAAAAQQHQRLTLPDGHLNVGMHLPLLAGRYKYLSTLGEGVSSRVGAASALLPLKL